MGFTKEFKKDALIIESVLGPTKTAKILNVNRRTLSVWVKKAEENGELAHIDNNSQECEECETVKFCIQKTNECVKICEDLFKMSNFYSERKEALEKAEQIIKDALGIITKIETISLPKFINVLVPRNEEIAKTVD